MLFNYIRFVFDQFLQHKVRFLLTVSGIVVGVSSLAILASFITVGKGILSQTSTQASGDDLLTIRDDWSARDRFPNERRISSTDLEALSGSRTLQHTRFVAQYGMRDRTIVFQGIDESAMVMGMELSGFDANQLEVAAGRLFLPEEMQDFSRVAVVGATLLEDHPKPWVGSSIQIEKSHFRIVGVLKEKPTMGPGRRWSWNTRIILPTLTYNIMFNPTQRPDSIVGRVSLLTEESTLKRSLEVAQDMSAQVLMLFRENKNFSISGAEDRDSNEDTIELVIQVLMIMTTVFSMIVGGINIMNIMLVTVTERTREIGIRRALGATQRDVLIQFLMESVLITFSGAILGFVLSLGGLVLLSELLTRAWHPWPFYIAWWSVGLGALLTVVIGIVFGLSPALRASRLDPVDALRFE